MRRKLVLIVLLIVVITYIYNLPVTVKRYDPFVPTPGSQVYLTGEA